MKWLSVVLPSCVEPGCMALPMFFDGEKKWLCFGHRPATEDVDPEPCFGLISVHESPTGRSMA